MKDIYRVSYTAEEIESLIQKNKVKDVKGVVFVLNQDFLCPVSNRVKVEVVQLPDVSIENSNLEQLNHYWQHFVISVMAALKLTFPM